MISDLCPGADLRCCYSCVRLLAQASAQRIERARGVRIAPTVRGQHCADWQPVPDASRAAPEDRL